VFRHIHRAELMPKAGKQSRRIYPAGSGGEVVRVIGKVRVQAVDADKHIARAVVTEALDPIERGFEVADAPRTLADVPPKVSRRKVDAHVVASSEPLGHLGEHQIVFIDAGSKEGVEVGNRFIVLRRGDAWRQNLSSKEELSGEVRPDRSPVKDEVYPWEAIGEARAIYVREDSSTALITDSIIELNPGDRAELREGY